MDAPLTDAIEFLLRGVSEMCLRINCMHELRASHELNMQHEREAMEKERLESARNRECLSGLNNDTHQHNAFMGAQLDVLQREMEKARERNRELENKCDTMMQTMKALGQCASDFVMSSIETLESMETEISDSMQHAVESMRRIQDDADARQNLLGSELQQLRKELASVREARFHQNEVQTATTLELQARVSQAQNLHRMEEDRARHLEAELNNKLEEAKRAVSEIERSTLVANRAQEELASMHEMVSQTEARAQALEGTCTALRHNVEARESSYRRMDEALRAALSKRDTLSDHCSDLQKRLGESTLQVKRLEATQASVTRQIGDSAARLDEVRAEG